jgi:hypothetical protein
MELNDPELQPLDFKSRVPDLIRLTHFEDRVIICLISWNSLQKIRNLDPAIKVAVLSSNKRDRSIPFACAILAGWLSMRNHLITRTLAVQKLMRRPVDCGRDCQR